MLDEGRVREKQVGELLEFMEMKADGLETLAAGDFNSTVKTAEILKMVGEGRFADTFASLYPDSPGLTWDNQNPYAAGSNHPLPDRRIDYIFLRPSLNKRLKLKSAEVILTSPDEAGIFASDHYGLLAAFNENWSK
jgi:endonuclease/exonuclease/phosphatase family metal-dependent hydrolase